VCVSDRERKRTIEKRLPRVRERGRERESKREHTQESEKERACAFTRA